MPNLTPVHNDLIIKLGNMLDDPRIDETDDGVTATALDNFQQFSNIILNDRLNESYTWVTKLLLTKYGNDQISRYAPGVVTTQVYQWGSPFAINKDFITDLSFICGGHVFVKKTRADLDVDIDKRINYAYVIEIINGVNTLTAYSRYLGEFVHTNAPGTLLYVKSDRRDATTGVYLDANVAPDVALDIQWHHICLAYAAYRCAMDMGSAEWREKAQSLQEELKMMTSNG
jgi:hypothetical protein